MSLGSDALIAAVVSHAMASGYFDRVNSHEPKNSPGSGLTYAVWVDTIEAAPGQSGLISTTARVTLWGRIYGRMLTEPQDEIDPNMTLALDALFTAYSGDFELGSNARNIDLMGMAGVQLSSKAGYLDIGGNLFRVYTIVIPIIVNDAWSQSP